MEVDLVNIERTLEAIKGKEMHYNNQSDAVKFWTINDQKERVEIHFKKAPTVDRPFESIAGFVNDLVNRVQQNVVPQLPVIADFGNVSDDIKTVVAYMGSSDPMDRVVKSMMNDLDNIDSSTSFDPEKLNAKVKILSSVIDVEKTKIMKGTVVANLLDKKLNNDNKT